MPSSTFTEAASQHTRNCLALRSHRDCLSAALWPWLSHPLSAPTPSLHPPQTQSSPFHEMSFRHFSVVSIVWQGYVSPIVSCLTCQESPVQGKSTFCCDGGSKNEAEKRIELTCTGHLGVPTLSKTRFFPTRAWHTPSILRSHAREEQERHERQRDRALLVEFMLRGCWPKQAKHTNTPHHTTPTLTQSRSIMLCTQRLSRPCNSQTACCPQRPVTSSLRRWVFLPLRSHSHGFANLHLFSWPGDALFVVMHAVAVAQPPADGSACGCLLPQVSCHCGWTQEGDKEAV